MKNFIEFIRKQGVVGLAVGFMLGGAVSKFVSAFVTDIVNPLLSGVLGNSETLQAKTFHIGSAIFKWGDFVNSFVDFIVISFVVYFGVKLLKLDRLDIKEEIKN